jgi:hypothetical protein
VRERESRQDAKKERLESHPLGVLASWRLSLKNSARRRRREVHRVRRVDDVDSWVDDVDSWVDDVDS